MLALTGIAAQMCVTIFIGTYCGKLLDEKFPSEKKWFTIVFTLLSVAVALYSVLKQVNRINDSEDESKK